MPRNWRCACLLTARNLRQLRRLRCNGKSTISVATARIAPSPVSGGRQTLEHEIGGEILFNMAGTAPDTQE
jgi:hypothetical protein